MLDILDCRRFGKTLDCRSKTAKGQIFSTDLMFAASVFLILLAFVWYSWDDMQYDINRKLELSDMQNYALSISDALVMTSGSPHNWTLDAENAQSIGLVTLPRQISQDRLDALVALPYDAQREKLGSGRFDFWLAIKTANGAVLSSTGSTPAGNMQVGLERIVVQDGEERIVNIVLWEDYKSSFVSKGMYAGSGL